ncbi:pyridoxamine 5'-phosphate oxidase family protein [Streptomyces albofaciens]|uniref:pyridoxamine 5'-phosphate oxidase family protein n=1 Tax=Streptomyces albofaciens TaxID=66866 RepID=UPI003CC6F0F2
MGTTDRADRFYDDQVLDHLNARMREFVGRQEMFFLATADRHGECDSTFRAGPPGFVQVLDERTIAYPEYRGNGVMASIGNISENPNLGILMIDFTHDRIGLHVNGRARVVMDDEMRERHPYLPVDPVPGRRAQLWVEVAVEETYIHCAKHIPHLQKVPRQASGPRAWGTDDAKRKGGDFFGAAAEAASRRRGPACGEAEAQRAAEAQREAEGQRAAEAQREAEAQQESEVQREAGARGETEGRGERPPRGEDARSESGTHQALGARQAPGTRQAPDSRQAPAPRQAPGPPLAPPVPQAPRNPQPPGVRQETASRRPAISPRPRSREVREEVEREVERVLARARNRGATGGSDDEFRGWFG